MSADLKDCPFCGSDAVFVQTEKRLFFVLCQDCKARGPAFTMDVSARRMWATRVGREGEIEWLREACAAMAADLLQQPGLSATDELKLRETLLRAAEGGVTARAYPVPIPPGHECLCCGKPTYRFNGYCSRQCERERLTPTREDKP